MLPFVCDMKYDYVCNMMTNNKWLYPPEMGPNHFWVISHKTGLCLKIFSLLKEAISASFQHNTDPWKHFSFNSSRLMFLPRWKQMHRIQYMWQALIAMRRDFKEHAGLPLTLYFLPPRSETTVSRSVSKPQQYHPRAKAVLCTLTEGSRVLSLSISLPLMSPSYFSSPHCLEIGRYNI